MLVALALGSNLGDRQANLAMAIAKLLAAGAIRQVRVSTAVETAPIDCADGAPGFLNAVLVAETSLAPLELLGICQRIERDMGRAGVRPKNADRRIDLDLLMVGDVVMDTPELTLPHPAMHERDFVMVPLSELMPEAAVGPEGRTAREAAESAPIQSILSHRPRHTIDWR